jgi:hypothetical protein
MVQVELNNMYINIVVNSGSEKFSWNLRSIDQCWNEDLWHRAFNISRWNKHSIAALRLYSNFHHGSTVMFLFLFTSACWTITVPFTHGNVRSPSNVSARSLASVQHLALRQEMNRTSCIYTYISPHGATAPSAPGPPHCRSFTITLRDRKSTRLNSSHVDWSRMPSSAW